MLLGDGGAGLGSFGFVIMPLMIAAMILKQPPGPVAKLMKARAISPDSARRLEKMGVPRPYVVDSAVRRGVVRRTDDGRYWVDLKRNRCFRRRVALVTGSTTLIGLAMAWWFLEQVLAGGGIAS